jgi:hypothetical protein
VLINMTAIIDDDIHTANLVNNFTQEWLVSLTTLKDLDPVLLQVSLVVDIDSKNVRVWEEGFPHAKGVSAQVGLGISANSDLKDIEALRAQSMKMGLIVLQIPVAAPLVGAKEGA